MRGPDPGFRRTAVLLLLAPRARERTVHEEGGLRRARRLRKGQVGSLAPDRRLLPEGGAGVREEAISDREPDHGGSYLYLGTGSTAGRVPFTLRPPVPRWGIFIPPRPFVEACASRRDLSADS